MLALGISPFVWFPLLCDFFDEACLPLLSLLLIIVPLLLTTSAFLVGDIDNDLGELVENTIAITIL